MTDGKQERGAREEGEENLLRDEMMCSEQDGHFDLSSSFLLQESELWK